MRGIPATVSGKLALLALVAMALAHGVTVYLLEGELPPFALIMEGLMLVLAASILTGWWWTNVAAGVIAGLLFISTIFGSLSSLNGLGDPRVIAALVFGALALIAAVAGIWSGVQALRSR